VHIDKNIAVNVPELAKRLFFICSQLVFWCIKCVFYSRLVLSTTPPSSSEQRLCQSQQVRTNTAVLNTHVSSMLIELRWPSVAAILQAQASVISQSPSSIIRQQTITITSFSHKSWHACSNKMQINCVYEMCTGCGRAHVFAPTRLLPRRGVHTLPWNRSCIHRN